MSERHDPAAARGGGAPGGAGPDPLARIGARLIDAERARRTRRRHARQRLVGAALTLLLIAMATVAAPRPVQRRRSAHASAAGERRLRAAGRRRPPLHLGRRRDALPQPSRRLGA